jgi:enolase-phosphatase E1
MPRIHGISHLLLDIEGTTCPVSFVSQTLFPYAAERLGTFLEQRAADPEVQRLLREAGAAWDDDQDPAARQLWSQLGGQASALAQPAASIARYLQLLITQDRKLTALKDLQGLIWAAGYDHGELVAPLFADVVPALRRWHAKGVVLAVYSSGSVPAQQLLYGHTRDGDLRTLFQHWFDTRTGPKQMAASYAAIASSMGVSPGQVLFLSDSRSECEAAHGAGMAVLFSDRADNPHRDSGPFEKIGDYGNLQLEP